MKGFQITFFTQQNRRHGRQLVHEWLLELSKTLDIKGATVTTGAEGISHTGKVHSAHFFELADQPVEVTMVVTEAQSASLFERLEQERADLFYSKTPVEFGRVGAP
jgi:PII-like signaling protein